MNRIILETQRLSPLEITAEDINDLLENTHLIRAAVQNARIEK